MTTQVGICNRALNYLATKTISSINEAVEQAIRCNLIYDDVRDSVLRDHEWQFATSITTLSELADETVPGWEYLYVYPTSCLKVRRVFDDNESSKPEEIEFREVRSPDTSQRAIVCNSNPAYCEYTHKVTDTTQYDPKFVEAFALKLASELAKSLTGNMDVGIKLLQLYNVALSDAKRLNKEEQNYDTRGDSTYLEARE